MPTPALESARAALRLTYQDLARVLQVDESTLHRWRSGVLDRRRSAAAERGSVGLERLLAALQARFGTDREAGVGGDVAPDASDAARRWLDAPHALCGGEPPRRVLLDGRVDFVVGLLLGEQAALDGTYVRQGLLCPAAAGESGASDAAVAPTAGPDDAAGDLTFAHAPVGLARLSLPGEFLAVNARFAAFLGATPAELVGLRVHDVVHPDDLAAELDGALRLVTGADATASGQTRYRRADGRVVWARSSRSLVRDAAGAPRYLLTALEPLPDVEAAALRLAIGHGPGLADATEGVWEWDVASGEVYWSAQIAATLGRRPDEGAPSFDEFAALVHPDDRAATHAALAAYVDGRARAYDAEFRMRHADGGWRWVHARGRALARDAHGRPTRIVGLHTDVTERRATEDALRHRERRFRSLVEATAAILWSADADGRRPRVENAEAWFALSGRSAEDSADGTWLDVVHPDDRAAAAAAWTHAVRTTTPYAVRFRVRRRGADGGFAYRVHDVRAVPVRDADGTLLEWMGVLEDVDDAARTETALRESEARYRAFVETAPQLAWSNDADGTPRFFSPRWAEYTGEPPLADGGTRWLAAAHPDDRERLRRARADAIAHGRPYALDVRLRRHDGAFRWHSAHVAPLRDADGALLGWYGAAADVDDERQALAQAREAEAQLASQLALLETLLAATDDLVFAKDLEGRYRVANDATVRLLGRRSRDEVVGRTDDELLPPALAAEVRANDAAVLARGVPARFEERVAAAGPPTTYLCTKAPWRDGSGAVVGVVGVATDITARASQEARVAAERERLLTVLEQAPLFLAALRGPTHVFERANAAYLRIVGGRDVVGRTVAEALPEAVTQGFVDILDRVRATGTPYVGTGAPFVLDAAGPDDAPVVRYVDFVYAPLLGADGTPDGIVAAGTDVTERVLAERALAAARDAADLERRRLEAVLAALPVGVVVIEAPSGRVRSVNRMLGEIWGHTTPSARVEDYSVTWHGLHVVDGVPTDRPYASHEWPVARVLAGAPPILNEPVVAVRPDGSRRMVSVSAAAVRDADDRIVGATAVIADVDEEHRTRRALHDARAAAERASRVKTEFLANMSHELRTPLNAIQGYAQLLELEVHGAVTGAQRTALERIQRAQRHLLGLISDMLHYAKLEAGRVAFAMAAVDLGEVMRDVAVLVEPQMGARPVSFVVDAPAAPLPVWADADKLRQVLLNLLSNAAKFTPPGGRVALEADADDPAAVRVHVRDTGIGIPGDQLGAIFEPFVQVETGHTRSGQGTGLGLAISRDLAVGMGGALGVTSAVGAGSCFTLTLRHAGEDAPYDATDAAG